MARAQAFSALPTATTSPAASYSSVAMFTIPGLADVGLAVAGGAVNHHGGEAGLEALEDGVPAGAMVLVEAYGDGGLGGQFPDVADQGHPAGLKKCPGVLDGTGPRPYNGARFQEPPEGGKKEISLCVHSFPG